MHQLVGINKIIHYIIRIIVQRISWFRFNFNRHLHITHANFFILYVKLNAFRFTHANWWLNIVAFCKWDYLWSMQLAKTRYCHQIKSIENCVSKRVQFESIISKWKRQPIIHLDAIIDNLYGTLYVRFPAAMRRSDVYNWWMDLCVNNC